MTKKTKTTTKDIKTPIIETPIIETPIKELTDSDIFLLKKAEEREKIKTKVLSLAKDNKGLEYIRAFLVLEGIKGKEATELLKELKISRSGSEGLTYPQVLEYLGEEPRTEADLYSLILSEGTKNEARWINDRNKIRLTLNLVFNKFLETPFIDIAANADLKKAVKDKATAK